MKKVNIDSKFYPETGISTVRLYTPEGVFNGAAICSDVDREYISTYFGCELAEIRAWIQYYRYLIKLARSKVDVCRHLYKITPKNVKSSDIIFGELTKWEKTVSDLKESIHNMNDEITNLIKQRDDFVERVYRAKSVEIE